MPCPCEVKLLILHIKIITDPTDFFIHPPPNLSSGVVLRPLTHAALSLHARPRGQDGN